MVEDINGYHVHLRDVYYTDITSGYAQSLVIENIWVRQNQDPLWKVDKHDATLINSLNTWTIPQIDCWTKLKSPLLNSWFHSPALSTQVSYHHPAGNRLEVWSPVLPFQVQDPLLLPQSIHWFPGDWNPSTTPIHRGLCLMSVNNSLHSFPVNQMLGLFADICGKPCFLTSVWIIWRP